jgi:hypothetical protein
VFYQLNFNFIKIFVFHVYALIDIVQRLKLFCKVIYIQSWLVMKDTRDKQTWLYAVGYGSFMCRKLNINDRIVRPKNEHRGMQHTSIIKMVILLCKKKSE